MIIDLGGKLIIKVVMIFGCGCEGVIGDGKLEENLLILPLNVTFVSFAKSFVNLIFRFRIKRKLSMWKVFDEMNYSN